MATRSCGTGIACARCGMRFSAGSRVALQPVQTSDQAGHEPAWLFAATVEACPVCATCFLYGKEVVTPKGRRVVRRVKHGDASPFPVVTFGGDQWRDEEVMPGWQQG
jgi:hypothetical protein